MLADAELSDQVVRCVVEEAHEGTNIRASTISSVITALDLQITFSSAKHQNSLRILAAMRLSAADIVDECLNTKLTAFHQQLVNQVRVPLAEQRVQHKKKLESDFLQYLQLLSSYVQTCARFTMDATRVLMPEQQEDSQMCPSARRFQ